MGGSVLIVLINVVFFFVFVLVFEEEFKFCFIVLGFVRCWVVFVDKDGSSWMCCVV